MTELTGKLIITFLSAIMYTVVSVILSGKQVRPRKLVRTTVILGVLQMIVYYIFRQDLVLVPIFFLFTIAHLCIIRNHIIMSVLITVLTLCTMIMSQGFIGLFVYPITNQLMADMDIGPQVIINALLTLINIGFAVLLRWAINAIKRFVKSLKITYKWIVAAAVILIIAPMIIATMNTIASDETSLSLMAVTDILSGVAYVACVLSGFVLLALGLLRAERYRQEKLIAKEKLDYYRKVGLASERCREFIHGLNNQRKIMLEVFEQGKREGMEIFYNTYLPESAGQEEEVETKTNDHTPYLSTFTKS